MSASAVDSISVENVVASAAIDQELDLQSLAMDIDAEYDPDKFPGAIYETTDPSATVLLFRSGKLVCTGATSVENVHAAIDSIVERLGSLGLDTGDPEVTVQNIVSSGNLGESLNLNAIAIGLGLEDVEYEPEQFPGLVYRLDDPEVVLLLFGSGRTVITGATDLESARAAMEQAVSALEDLGLLG